MSLCSPGEVGREIVSNAGDATRFLKALANENRLLVLCHLLGGEKSVTELEALLGIRQPTLSQQLARLRADALVETRRAAKSIYYRLANDDVAQMLQTLHGRYCQRIGSVPVRPGYGLREKRRALQQIAINRVNLR